MAVQRMPTIMLDRHQGKKWTKLGTEIGCMLRKIRSSGIIFLLFDRWKKEVTGNTSNVTIYQVLQAYCSKFYLVVDRVVLVPLVMYRVQTGLSVETLFLTAYNFGDG